jgi:hypothetical protein
MILEGTLPGLMKLLILSLGHILDRLSANLPLDNEFNIKIYK